MREQDFRHIVSELGSLLMYFWMYPEWYPDMPYGRPALGDSGTGGGEDHAGTVDETLVHEVAQALLDDPAVTGGVVDLRVQNGVAILDGDIESEDARAAAVTTAASIHGIRDVCDVLVVTGTSRRR